MSNLQDHKICLKCGKDKPMNEFGLRSRNKDGRETHCKECHNEEVRQYRKEKPDVVKAIARKARQKEGLEKRRIRHKKWRDEVNYCQSDNFKLLMAKYRNSEKGREYYKNYRKNYYKTPNGKRVVLDSIKKQWKTNPILRIKHALRRRIRDCFRGQKFWRSNSYKELLGCDFNVFKEYIESLFQEGMSWDTYGRFGWHIDHIIPCVSFDLTKIEEQKKCFHYTNLQPLWWWDNLAKGTKVA